MMGIIRECLWNRPDIVKASFRGSYENHGFGGLAFDAFSAGWKAAVNAMNDAKMEAEQQSKLEA